MPCGKVLQVSACQIISSTVQEHPKCSNSARLDVFKGFKTWSVECMSTPPFQLQTWVVAMTPGTADVRPVSVVSPD